MQKSIEIAQTVVAGVFLARDLVNEPPSVATARFLGEQAAEAIAAAAGLSAEVWDKRKIESMKLAGLLAVNRGSHEEPRFIKIHYKPAGKPKKKIALIGKGITFDSGGLSLKPSKSMETMKLDMAGGAAVIAAMSCLPKLGLDIDVTGYVPTTDNLPGHNAQKPGDVIRYLNGKTIEVLNTDAEGRLILADALALAARAKARLHDQSGDFDRRLHGRSWAPKSAAFSATTSRSRTRCCAAPAKPAKSFGNCRWSKNTKR